MFAFSRPLGDAVKKARMEKGLTQGQLATLVDADERTIISIEIYKANYFYSIQSRLLGHRCFQIFMR